MGIFSDSVDDLSFECQKLRKEIKELDELIADFLGITKTVQLSHVSEDIPLSVAKKLSRKILMNPHFIKWENRKKKEKDILNR